mmetsp:Transcript_11209/g.24648  ORF Transcript_11209/g.24648 Transcript_11209/m.24648 type:complete len:91 (+) Transcript_11209:72-344(+)
MLDAVAFWIRRAMWGQRGSLVGDRSAAGGALWVRALDWAGFGLLDNPPPPGPPALEANIRLRLPSRSPLAPAEEDTPGGEERSMLSMAER